MLLNFDELSTIPQENNKLFMTNDLELQEKYPLNEREIHLMGTTLKPFLWIN